MFTKCLNFECYDSRSKRNSKLFHLNGKIILKRDDNNDDRMLVIVINRKIKN